MADMAASPWIIFIPSGPGYFGHRFRRAEDLARAVAAPLDLELALGKALGADQNLPGNAYQVGGGEFCAGALIGVVIEDVDALGLEFAIKRFAGGVGIAGALLQVQDPGGEGGNRLRPLDAGIVV